LSRNCAIFDFNPAATIRGLKAHSANTGAGLAKPASGKDPDFRKPWRLQHEAIRFAAIGLALLFLQWQSGAWTAEFDGHPDESAQFVTGQFLRQFALSLPLRHPIDFACRYYLHYPKVAIGHWPPGYPALEAAWTLAFGRSRLSAMLLQWLLGTAALAGLYHLARSFLPPAISLTIIVAAAATPVFQQGLEQTMAEPASLLCGVLFMLAAVRLLEKPGQRVLLAVVSTVFAAVLVKGTGVCLAPPALAVWLASSRQMPKLTWKLWLAAVAMLALIAAWYWGAGNVVGSGIVFQSPVGWSNIGRIAGWGFVVLAASGVSRKPVPIVAALMIASMLAVASFVPHLAEPRHWILILPALLLLAGHAVSRFPLHTIPLAIAAVALFPYSRYHQEPAGYQQLFHQLPLPVRIMVSSGYDSGGEGAGVAEVNLRDRLMESVVMRASKVLAISDWNGNSYQLLVEDAAEVRRRLDQLAVDRVVLHRPDADIPPHHALLRAAVEGSTTWRLCAISGQLKAYCRTRAPGLPRLPLEMYAGGRHIVESLAAIK
jgi:hypothetical protein